MEWFAAGAGLLTGSFLNVCIARLPDDYSVVTPRSHCPACGAGIAWYDNVPVLSFLLLRGRCRQCRAPISWRYPLVELLTAVLFFAVVQAAGWNWAAAKWCVFAALLIELSFSDLETRILPDEFTKGGIAAGLFFAAVVPLPEGLVSMLIGAPTRMAASFVEALAAALLLPFLLWTVGEVFRRVRGREGLGFGDVKLVGLLGAFLGLETAVLVLALSSVLGLAIGLPYIYWRKEDPGHYELPFGTFLGLGGLLCLVWEVVAGLGA